MHARGLATYFIAIKRLRGWYDKNSKEIMQRTKIDWASHVWNPVVGCERNCSYCYAKKLNDRYKFIPKFNEPVFLPQRLNEPYKLKKPATIFVCSMAELFRKWKYPYAGTVEKVIKVAIENPRHKFMFLTKNPKRLSRYVFPDNAWVGVSIENQKAVNERLKHFNPNYAKHKFISFEPLLGEIELDGILEGIDFVIIGAQTNPTIKPAIKWVNSILDECEVREIPVCVKQNLQKLYPQEAL